MSYASTILADTPRDYYRLGEGLGTVAYDSTANAQNGTIAGGVTLAQTGALQGDSDTAMLLNGSTGYITLGSAILNGLSTCSVELWVKTTSSNSGVNILANKDVYGAAHTGFELACDTSGTHIYCNIGNGTSVATVAIGSSLTTGTWYHIVITFDGTTVRTYLNGVAASTASLSGSIGSSSYLMTIGRNPEYNGAYFNGTVDEVAFYNTTLTLTQIANHYNVGNPPPPPLSPTAITITNDGRNLMRDGMSGTNNPKITYVALGSLATTPSINDHQLGNEVYRKAVTSYTNGTAGEIFVTMHLGNGEAIGDDIEEIGLFAGNTATSAANTGVLFARGLYQHNPKTSLESITFTIDQTFT